MKHLLIILIALTLITCKKDDDEMVPCVLQNYQIEYSIVAEEDIPHRYVFRYSSGFGVDISDHIQLGPVLSPFTFYDDLGRLCKCGTGVGGGTLSLLIKVLPKDADTVKITARIKVNGILMIEDIFEVDGESLLKYLEVKDFRCAWLSKK